MARATAGSAAARAARNRMMSRPRSLKRVIRYTPASMIPQARLQPSAPSSMVRTSRWSAVATASVQVKVSAMITPNSTSEMRSIGSRTRSDGLPEDCTVGSIAIRAGSLSNTLAIDRPVDEADQAGAADDVAERHRDEIMDDARNGD